MIPESVHEAYDAAMATALQVRRFAGNRLRILAVQNNWLFDDRIKSIESCLSKLEAGSVALSKLHDFYGAMVVVPTRNEVEIAIENCLRLFEGQIKDRRDTFDAVDRFVYDDAHVIAHLGKKISPSAVSNDSVLNFEFEIQIRTSIQYAWWRATHDNLYKGAPETNTGRGVRRVAGQARATLELLDGVLSDMPTAAELTDASHFSPASTPNPLYELLELWRKADRPADAVRFFHSAEKLLGCCEVPVESARTALSGAEYKEVLSARVTPLQAVVVFLFDTLGAQFEERLLRSGLKILVTPELTTIRPKIRGLNSAVTTFA